jgi:hypothetical protein
MDCTNDLIIEGLPRKPIDFDINNFYNDFSDYLIDDFKIHAKFGYIYYDYPIYISNNNNDVCYTTNIKQQCILKNDVYKVIELINKKINNVNVWFNEKNDHIYISWKNNK